jgi:hypothetical protein
MNLEYVVCQIRESRHKGNNLKGGYSPDGDMLNVEVLGLIIS